MADRILIVDDDPVQRRLLHGQITRMGYEALVACDGEEALELLAGQARQVSAVVLDLVMPHPDGIAVLEAMRQRRIGVPVIVQTAKGGIETVVHAMRAGAFDFVVKPVSPERLQVSLANALKIGALAGEVTRFARAAEGRLTFRDLICASRGMEEVVRIGERAARSHIPVLIEGESGVGKELVARAIQGASERRARPFVTVNCGALPENLVESILFGHEKGAFTGASDKHVGKFEEATGGTLFLDEVGELPLDIQVKLLRAIQEGEIDPVGARRPVKVDIRLISATNKDLHAEVRAGRFREDLYYRLNVLALNVPPLRERTAEIPLLVRHFMERFAAMENRPHLRAITAEAEAMLCAYDWPGNIRQLENAVFRAVVLAEGNELTLAEFPQIAAQVRGFGPLPAAEARGALDEPPGRVPISLAPPPLQPTHENLPPEIPDVRPLSATPAGWLPLLYDDHVRPLEQVEAELIRFALDHYRGRMSEVARRLGIGRSTLYRKLRDYHLEPAASGSPEDDD